MKTSTLPPMKLRMASLVLAFLGGAAADTGQGFSLIWSTVDGGGGTSTGGVFTVTGTIGQTDAGGR